MSRKSCREYLARMRVLYAQAGRRRKGELLTEMQEVAGMERKYLNKLMTGNRRHRARTVRGPTYGEKEKGLLRRAWEKSGDATFSRGRPARRSGPTMNVTTSFRNSP